MSRSCDETCQVPLLRVFRWMWKGLGPEKCDIFAEYYMGLEVNNPSQLKPSWRPHHHGGGEMRSETRGL